MECRFEKRKGRVVPAEGDERAWNFINRLDDGVTFVADVKDPSRRSGKQHNFWFAMIHELFQNQSLYKNFDHFREQLLIVMGYCAKYPRKDGSMGECANSLAFGKMAPEAFSALVEDTLDFAENLGWDRNDLLAKTEESARGWR